MKPTSLFLTLTTVLSFVGLSLGVEICYGNNICLSCPDCGSISPSYSTIFGYPTAGELIRTCTCFGCGGGFPKCVAIDKTTGEPVPDSTPVPPGDDLLPSDKGSSNDASSSSGVFYECPAGCDSVSYSPVIFGSEISVKDVVRGCTCMGCPGAPFPSCKIIKDGEELGPDDVLSASEAFNAQRAQTAGVSTPSGSIVSVTDSQSSANVIIAVVSSLCGLLLI